MRFFKEFFFVSTCLLISFSRAHAEEKFILDHTSRLRVGMSFRAGVPERVEMMTWDTSSGRPRSLKIDMLSRLEGVLPHHLDRCLEISALAMSKGWGFETRLESEGSFGELFPGSSLGDVVRQDGLVLSFQRAGLSYHWACELREGSGS